MNLILKRVLASLIGSRSVYRLGRALYLNARGDSPHDMMSNGEMLIQSHVVDAWENGALGGSRLVVFDVGANVGDWSAALLSHVQSTKNEGLELYLFEPIPSTFEQLGKRMGTQKPNIHFEQVALSSESGVGSMFVSGQCAGTNSLHADSLGNDEDQMAVIRATTTGFCLARNIRKIHLLKCDTEGHDMEVIRGALQLLVEGNISVFQFEYNHRWIFSRNFLRDAFAVIEKLPYKLVKLQPDQLLVLNEWHPELERFFHGNYAFVHVDALCWFPTQLVSWDRYNTMSV